MQPTGRSPAVSGVAPDNRTRHATTSQQWLALISAGLAWLFDAMDLQIFTLVLFPSVSALIGSTDSGRVAGIGGIIVACKLLSWGVGGIVFGVVADRVGRARTMLITVLIYSAFTGLSALAQTWWQLAVLQALAGIGLGGEWAAGAALVAESWPERTRARATQVMQMCFGLGFFAAAALNLFVGPFGWRWVFVAGVAPAPIILVLRLFVRESPRWLAVRQQRPIDARRDSKTATLRAIFAPGMRRRTVVATLIALAMMLGSNSLAPIAPTWVHQLLPHDQQPLAGRTISHFYMLASFGGLLGYVVLMWPIERLGRRLAYSGIVLGCAAMVLVQFLAVTTVAGLLTVAPVYGFFAIGGFGFFAVYFPELFPTAIRATGQGFAWNLARSLAALGPVLVGALVRVLGSPPAAGRVVAVAYVIGLVAIWFGPETKGQRLQD